ncbi:type I restriction modification DNA specificity domain protein [Burkholderia pseudomallei]|nr:type I restriction modification DNA specificity domain protein [Burkholderia pseudomallei]CAJ4234451.1 type I restriction modification DNA specificity domain protein [Burkholderia pseudomallei]CAK0569098.1 type I restriction modification DNA specificity domain protein [Burkholderia pseudomallei]
MPIWKTKALSSVADINPQKLKVIERSPDSDVHFVPMAAVTEEYGGIDIGATRKLKDVVKGYTQFAADDVLFAKITPCMENGKVAVAPELPLGIGYGSTEFHVIRPSSDVRSRWIAYFLSRADTRSEARRNMTGSAGQLRVPTKWLDELKLPVPSLEIQDSVLALVDEQLSDLDAGVAGLARAQANLKRYRASLLNAAMEGRLTADWRVNNPATETGGQLLTRILKERRENWEANQIAKFSAKGKQLPTNWQRKYEEPVAPDAKNLPELPTGWCWATLEQLAGLITSGSRGWAQYYSDSGPIFIRSQDINGDFLNIESVAHVSPPQDSEGGRTRVLLADLLITITGANVAKCAEVTFSPDEAYVSQHVALVRPVWPKTSRYLHTCLVCDSHGRRQLLKFAYGAGKPGLNLQQVSSVAIPLPPLAEQMRIGELLDEQLATQSKVAVELERQVKRAGQLRQSILKAAFAGTLASEKQTSVVSEQAA